MEILKLILTPKDEVNFEVYAVNFGKTETTLPFCEDNQNFRSTLNWLLESTASEYQPYQSEFFSTDEQEWLLRVGILNPKTQNFLDYPTLLANLGKKLYQSLFPAGSISEKALNSLWQQANQNDEQLHLQLQFEADSVDQNRAADYPWELMHNGDKFLAWHGITFSRYIAYQDLPPKLPPVEKVNVLLVSSEAYDSSQGLHKFKRSERKTIRDGLDLALNQGHINLVDLAEEIDDYPTFKALKKYLTENRGEKQPHVLHFDGHGIYGKQCPKCQKIYGGINSQNCENLSCQNQPLSKAQGYLLFEDEKGNPDYISAETLGATLKSMTSGGKTDQKGRLTVAVLSACQSGMAATGESVFNGTAQKLIEYSIPAVVAMQYSVDVEAAIDFAEQFYTALGQKDSLSNAILQARIAMGVEGNQWYRPVLYLRWDANDGGELFAQATLKNIKTSLSERKPEIEVITDNRAIMIPSLNYNRGSLSKLKSIFFNLRGDASYKGGKIEITIQQISEWIKEIDIAEEQIDNILDVFLEVENDSET